MKQIFHRYELWEDYQNGMFVNKKDAHQEARIEQACYLFKDEEKLFEEMKYVAFNWKHAAEVNFTNPSINYQAWLGQASCCHYCGCGDFETIEAWHRLTDKERQHANDIADKVFRLWVRNFEKTQPQYQLSLFEEEEI